MATTNDGSLEFMGIKREACSFCGREEPAAYWAAAASYIFVCKKCAVHTLPCLLADATCCNVILPRMQEVIERVWEQATSRFYTGISQLLLRRLKAAEQNGTARTASDSDCERE